MNVGQNVRGRIMRRLRALAPGSGTRRTGHEPPLDGDADAGNGRSNRREGGSNDPSIDPTAEQLATPRERVLTLLARNGGRMKQGDLVDTVEWSESTVSRRLCDLEAEEAVVRYRIGREKVVFIPGEEPASFRSPIEREDERKTLAA